MQSSGSGSGGPSRNPGVGPAGRATSSSPSSTPHLGFDSLQHQQQHIGSTSRQVCIFHYFLVQLTMYHNLVKTSFYKLFLSLYC